MSRTVSAIAAFILAFSAVTVNISAADTGSVDNLVKQAQKAMVDGKYKAAMAALDQAITAAPDRADLYGMRAKVHDERGDLDKALDDAKKMIDLAPDDARGYMVRAAIYRRNEKYEEALVDANAAITRNPKSADAYYTRSDIYNDMGKAAESKADEAKANALDR
jgi:tetratricopeptide (TPR) repeat protein